MASVAEKRELTGEAKDWAEKELRSALDEARHQAHCYKRVARAEELAGKGDVQAALEVLRAGQVEDLLSLALVSANPPSESQQKRVRELAEAGEFSAAKHALRCRFGG